METTLSSMTDARILFDRQLITPGIQARLDAGDVLGVHHNYEGSHLTALRLDAGSAATGERMDWCHDCEGYAAASSVTYRLLPDPAAGVRETPTRYGGSYYTNGRGSDGRYAGVAGRVTLVVTARGHWYRLDDVRDGLHNDNVCRGCGYTGHFDYILDHEPCRRPATATDVVVAFKSGARAFQPGDQVRGYKTELGGHFRATVTRVYFEDVLSVTEVCDLALASGGTAVRVSAGDLRLAV